MTQPSSFKGLWTPTLVFATPAASAFAYGTQIGQFTYNNGLVELDWNLTFTPTLGGASGNLQLQGLPFPANNAGGWAAGFARLANAAWTGLAAAPTFVRTIDPANIVIYTLSGVTQTNLAAANCTDGQAHSYQGTLVYSTNT